MTKCFILLRLAITVSTSNPLDIAGHLEQFTAVDCIVHLFECKWPQWQSMQFSNLIRAARWGRGNPHFQRLMWKKECKCARKFVSWDVICIWRKLGESRWRMWWHQYICRASKDHLRNFVRKTKGARHSLRWFCTLTMYRSPHGIQWDIWMSLVRMPSVAETHFRLSWREMHHEDWKHGTGKEQNGQQINTKSKAESL